MTTNLHINKRIKWKLKRRFVKTQEYAKGEEVRFPYVQRQKGIDPDEDTAVKFIKKGRE